MPEHVMSRVVADTLRTFDELRRSSDIQLASISVSVETIRSGAYGALDIKIRTALTQQ